MASEGELKRLILERGIKKSSLTKLINRIKEMVDAVQAAAEPADDQLDSIYGKTSLISSKLKEIKEYDQKIIAATQDERELERTMIDADDYASNVEENHAIFNCVHKRLTTAKDKRTSNPPIPTHATSSPAAPSPAATGYRKVNLPKLSLSTFDGNIIEWTTFIDGFKAAVHNDNALENVQKFQYLRGQLQGDAARAIEGLSLTDGNYVHAMDILKERYGKTHLLKNAHMKALWDLPKPAEDDIASLRTFYDKLESNIRGLNSIGMKEETYGDLLVPLVLDKLPKKIRFLITRDHGDKEWKLPELREAILKEINTAEAGNCILDLSPSTDTHHQPMSSVTFLTPSSTSKRNCFFCGKDHQSANCEAVVDPGKRREIVIKKNRCTNCFGPHHIKACRSSHRCRKCNKFHHTALHDPNYKPKAWNSKSTKSAETPAPKTEEKNQVNVTLTPTPGPVLLKTTVAKVASKSATVEINILLDEGAQRTFITERTAKLLNVNDEEYQMEHLRLGSFGTDQTGVQAIKALDIHLKTNSEDIAIRSLVVPKISAPIQNLVKPTILCHKYLQDLPLAPQPDATRIEIDMLIGADHYWSIVQDQIVRGDGPTAVSSKLGYLLSGPSNFKDSHAMTTTNILTCLLDPSPEETMVSRFWDLETLGISKNENNRPAQEPLFEDYRDTKITRDGENYVAGFPWKQDHAPLPTNHNLTETRTRSMARRLSQETRNIYDGIIKDQLSRGFIEKVTHDDPSRGHYLPHHAVEKDSTTTPVRIVYNCSAKFGKEPSLNDCIEAGPSLINDLGEILLRFRMKPVGITSDIEKAFLNVNLNPEDRDYTKFFWLADPTDPESEFEVYRFKVVLFGSKSSPFMLNAVVKTHLQSQPCAISEDLERNIYVDNVLSSVNDSSEAADYYSQSVQIMRDAGFNLRSWATNDPKMQETFATDGTAETKTQVNVLGLLWDTRADTLQYPVPSNKHNGDEILTTKREIVRTTSSLFDPLGFLSPVHVLAKSFIQKLWKSKFAWDEPLSEDLTMEWYSINNELNLARDISLNRSLFTETDTSDESTELHVFADASKTTAYGAVAYLKRGNETALVMAKSRINPTDAITLPRLELMAAVTATRLANFVAKALLNVNISKRILWSDSQIVIHWIRSQKQLPVFVQNRVREIRQAEFQEIRYCPTQDNPADLITRGLPAEKLRASDLWWHGPHWLKSEIWPQCELFNNPADQTDISEHHVVDTSVNKVACESTVASPGVSQVIDQNRYNSMTKLLRVTALVLRFIQNSRQPDNRQQGHLTAQELSNAETMWIKDLQNQYFSREIATIKAKEKTIGTLVRQLCLFLDDDGILRVGGRLHNAPLDYSSKFPILIPRQTQFARLIVLNSHSNVSHLGLQATITDIRKRFWIPQIRAVVKSILHNCFACKLVSGKHYPRPIPAPLQNIRLQQAPPFTVTGVDFTGAVYFREGNSEGKGYICLFTCAVTRAVHLELVTDLTTQTFLNAFRRFAARRSLPSKMLSDNASTYLSAAEELKKLLNSTTVKNYMSNHKVEWSFIPKRAPWFGGFWERLIGVTKNCMKKVLGRAYVTRDELNTVLTEVEAGLNDRPLTYISTDTTDYAPLSPSHLLHGHPTITVPHIEIDADELSDPTYGGSDSLIDRYNRINTLLSHFWKRWSTEYLAALREQDRLSGKGVTSNSIKVGDVVLIEDSSVPRLKWHMALVEKVHPGNDGLIRFVDLKTKFGHTNRPISKLYPLEVSMNNYEPETKDSVDNTSDSENKAEQQPDSIRPSRMAALKARQRVKDWTDILKTQ